MMYCIDIFAGCGAAACGLTHAGFRHLFACEWNFWATVSFQANFPGIPVDRRNLFLWSAREILAEFQVPSNWQGLVWLSPPCPGFSTAGKKLGEEDVRNQLLFKAVEFAEALPNAFLIVENVCGLEKGKAKSILERFLSDLRRMGRKPVVREINALDFGLGAVRNRIFIIIPPLGMNGESFDLAPSSTPMTMRDVIGPGFQDPDPEFFELEDNEVVLYSEIPPGGNYASSERGKRYGALLNRNAANRKGFLRRPTWDEPCGCLLTFSGSPSFRVAMLHPSDLRHLSVGEMRELQGLPKDFLVAGPLAERVLQIGNGVAVPVSQAIGLEVMRLMQVQR